MVMVKLTWGDTYENDQKHGLYGSQPFVAGRGSVNDRRKYHWPKRRWPKMIKSVFFLSRSQAESFARKQQPRPFAMISITDPDSKPANIARTHQGLLRFQFDDVYEEVKDCKAGQIPDLLPDDLPLIIHGEEWVDANHAKRILEFIKNISNREGDLDLVVHCEGGISRSAAIAAFVADKYSATLEMVSRDASGANRRLTRLLRKVDAGEPLDCRLEFDKPSGPGFGSRKHIASMGWA